MTEKKKKCVCCYIFISSHFCQLPSPFVKLTLFTLPRRNSCQFRRERTKTNKERWHALEMYQKVDDCDSLWPRGADSGVALLPVLICHVTSHWAVSDHVLKTSCLVTTRPRCTVSLTPTTFAFPPPVTWFRCPVGVFVCALHFLYEPVSRFCFVVSRRSSETPWTPACCRPRGLSACLLRVFVFMCLHMSDLFKSLFKLKAFLI